MQNGLTLLRLQLLDLRLSLWYFRFGVLDAGPRGRVRNELGSVQSLTAVTLVLGRVELTLNIESRIRNAVYRSSQQQH